MVKNKIFVTGSIRSGTTFVGRALSSSQDSIYIHEPFNPDSPWNSSIPIPIKNFYINDHNKRIYDHRVSRLLKLSPEITGKWQENIRLDRLEYINNAFPKGTEKQDINIVLKDPIGVFCTEWLVNSWQLKPVIVVRDPRDVIKSIYRLSWHKNLSANWIKMQPELHKYLSSIEECLSIRDCISINKSNNDLDNVISYLKPIYLALLYFSKVLGFYMVCYERLTRDSVVEFNKLFEFLGMTMNEEFSQSLNNKNNYFDYSKAHQNTSSPVDALKIRELYSKTDKYPDMNENKIMDSFQEIKDGFRNNIAWWTD